MVFKFINCSLLVILILVEINCIQVFENNGENVTLTEPLVKNLNDETTTTLPDNLRSDEPKNDQNENETSEDRITTSPTTTTTHKIAPKLLNAKFEQSTENSERPEKSLKDIAKPTVAQFHPKNLGQSIDAKVKQAILHSKTQAFKNHNIFKVKQEVKRPVIPDQIARPAEVQNDISKENPKTFLPSPEVSPLFNRVQDNFAPMQEYHHPVNHNLRLQPETPFSTNPPSENRWLGENHSTNDIQRPIDVPRLSQFHQGRNTNINFPYHQTLHHHHQHHVHRQYSNEENFKFPSDEHSSEELRSTSWPSYNPTNIPSHPVPALNFKNTKGTWKWIPEEENHPKNSSEIYGFVPESKISVHETPLLYESRPQTTRDRPYSFDTQEQNPYSNSFNHHSQPSPAALIENSRYPTGPAAWPSSGSDHLLPTEEYLVTQHEESAKGGITDHKHLRPSPWKKIIHVLGAAIPIGIIISALTPRIVYVHPNATVPTLQPTLNPSQQFQPPISGQVNGPFPVRQRSALANDSLVHFLKTMEMQFREKQLQTGEKLDGMCEDRFFCEIALMGRQPSADALHRTLYAVALETTNEDAKKSGLGEIFAAIKRQSCNVFDCNKI